MYSLPTLHCLRTNLDRPQDFIQEDFRTTVCSPESQMGLLRRLEVITLHLTVGAKETPEVSRHALSLGRSCPNCPCFSNFSAAGFGIVPHNPPKASIAERRRLGSFFLRYLPLQQRVSGLLLTREQTFPLRWLFLLRNHDFCRASFIAGMGATNPKIWICQIGADVLQRYTCRQRCWRLLLSWRENSLLQVR